MAKQNQSKRARVTDGPVIFCRTSDETHAWLHEAAGRAGVSGRTLAHRLLTILREIDEEANRDHDGAPLTAEYLGLRVATAMRGLLAVHPEIDRDAFRAMASGEYAPDVVDRLMGRPAASKREGSKLR